MNQLHDQSDVNAETLKKMERAFDEFHSAIMQLKKEQRDIIAEINKRIDQKKVQDIHSLLHQSQS